MKLFKNILARLSGDTPSPEAENNGKQTDATDNAIDRRENAVKAIVKSLNGAIGSTSANLLRMNIWVIVPSNDYDPTKFAWADNLFKSDLRLALDNSMLETVGKKKLEINFITEDRLPAKCVTVVANELYYSWEDIKEPSPTQTVEKDTAPAEAQISVIEGTGSLLKSPIIMSAKEKKSYKIGRGVSTRKYGHLRVNDIIISDSETDPALAEQNKYVSSAQAEIVIQSNTFYLKASEGGCRTMGGVATKIFRDDKSIELLDTDSLIPLLDNDQIELGKHVTLIFNTLNSQSK